MKKIILFIMVIILFYIVSIFVLPSVSSYIGEKIWLTWFNNRVIQLRDEFNEFVTNFDIMWKYKETKDSALEIKQTVESQVGETKQKIETIQTKIDETEKAIEQTKESVNQTLNTLQELQKSVTDIIPWSATGETQTEQ